MLLQNGGKRVLDTVDLEDSRPDFPPPVRPPVQRASENLSSCVIVARSNLNDAFRTALDVGHLRSM